MFLEKKHVSVPREEAHKRNHQVRYSRGVAHLMSKDGPIRTQKDIHCHMYVEFYAEHQAGVFRDKIFSTAWPSKKRELSTMKDAQDIYVKYILKQGTPLLKIGKPPAQSYSEKEKVGEKILALVRKGCRLSKMWANIAAKLLQYSPPRTYHTDVLYCGALAEREKQHRST